MSPRFVRRRPEESGFSPSAIARFVTALEAADTHSYLVVQDGSVIAEGWWPPCAPAIPHAMFSVSKSFTSTAVGLAVAEGRITLADRVVDLLPEHAPAVIGDRLAAVNVRHLLTMTAGHDADSLPAERRGHRGDWAAEVLAQPLGHEPGTVHVYDNGATHLLSAILTRVTGQRLLEYLRPRLFEPLGIEDVAWQQSPSRVDAGAWGLSLRTEDMAAFGELYRRGGRWGDAQLLPTDWVTEATRKQVETSTTADKPDWGVGYGYQFWRCRNGAFRADGAFGQIIAVHPEAGLVVAITGGGTDMQGMLNAISDHLVPGTRAPEPAVSTRAAGADLPAPAGSTGSWTYRLSPRATDSFGWFERDGPRTPGALLEMDLAVRRADIAGTPATDWRPATTELAGRPTPAAVQISRPSPDERRVTVRFVETPFELTLHLSDLASRAPRLRMDTNVAFGDTHLGEFDPDPVEQTEPDASAAESGRCALRLRLHQARLTIELDQDLG